MLRGAWWPPGKSYWKLGDRGHGIGRPPQEQLSANTGQNRFVQSCVCVCVDGLIHALLYR